MQLDRPVTEFLSHAAFTLRENLTIDQALATLRAGKPAEAAQSQVIYFYVVNDQDQLVGVLPSRQLVLAPGDSILGALMARDIISMSAHETLFDALELFAMHRLLAIPVVDRERKFLGIIEVSLYTDEIFDLAQNRQFNEIFQLVGLHLEQSRQGSPLAGFKLRMPWLLSNITGGLVCAALGSFFEATVKEVVIIALFIPLILTLAESISVQSMTLAIEQTVTKRQAPGQFRKEALVAMLLGLCSGLIVGLVSLFWRGPVPATITIGGSVAATMFLAAMLGRAVPKLIHLLKLNPRVASGPITLAVVDIVAITLYLSAATVLLHGH
jgi:magnesium transporter